MASGRFDPRRQSLANRVTALAAVAVGLSVTALSVAAYFTVRHELYSSLDDSLVSRAHAAAGADVVPDITANSIPSWMVGAADIRIALITADGAVATADTGTPETQIELGQAELDVATGTLARSVRTVVAGNVEFRVVAVPIREGGAALVLAQSLRATQDTLHTLALVLIILGLAGIIIAAIGGRMVARNGLKPLRKLTDAVESVARTDDFVPIEVAGDDEIARLATAFNAMLESLSTSRDLQRQLIRDASHELRTPLTSLRTNLDLLLQAEEKGGLTSEQRHDLMHDVAAQIAEMTDLIADLTELARDEHAPTVRQPVDLEDVVERAVDRIQRRTEGLEFRVDVSPWIAQGEDAALERAVANLLDNAAKWSPPLGTVRVSLKDGWVRVADEGPGVSEHDAAHVFERFYRAEEYRSLPGSGLGLSIVKHVAERHGGTASVGRSSGGGALFAMFIPGSPPEAESLTGGGSSLHSGPTDNADTVTT